MAAVVDVADASDCAEVIDLLRMKHGEDGLGRFSEERAHESVVRGAVTKNMARIGVIRGKTRIEATVGLFVDRPFDSIDQYLFDRWLFVHPDNRRSEHAKDLIIWSKKIALCLGVPLVLTTIVNQTTANKAKLYERQMPEGGKIFVFNPILELQRQTA